ncbi:hypothetical protein [Desulfonatronum lacustre]|uniref:hypothetical protein n=1 Tax=Desulfonatronum lacustre TaxID=66849 RepID=UPI0012EBDBEB|nr:hypothetical protein [Desulfonatronum lacustre]
MKRWLAGGAGLVKKNKPGTISFLLAFSDYGQKEREALWLPFLLKRSLVEKQQQYLTMDAPMSGVR